MSSEEKHPAQDLSTKIWKTRGSRLNSYRRLNVRAKLSLYLISIYSAYGLIASIFEKELSVALAEHPSALKIVLTSLSLFILIVSLIEGTSRNEIIASSLHENAKKLTPLLNKLETLRKQPPSDELLEKLKAINKKYSSIINSCTDNHSPIDYEKFKLEHKELASSVAHPKMIYALYHLTKIVFTVAVIMPLLALAIFIYSSS